MLALVYAGLQAFDGAFGFARSLKQRSPHSAVIVLTCSCESGHKADVLQVAVDEGHIDNFVMVQDCGGRLAMGVAIDKVITAFQQ